MFHRLESLESRVLLSGAFSQRVNFQPAGSLAAAYYLGDTGAAFVDHGNGLSYGWNADNSANARDRGSASNPDLRFATFNHMQKNGTLTWEIAVPNGTYTVRIAAGESDYFDSVFKINVEGVLVVNGTPTSTNRFIEGTATIVVSDGRLTVSSAPGASNNKIDFIEINAGTNPIPVVRVASTDPAASESGDSGFFTITRTGDLSVPLTVNYSLGGAAKNGADYDLLNQSVTFAPGNATAAISIHPIDDSLAEGSENVSLKLLPAANYSLASKFSATVIIADNDAQGKLSWTQKATAFARAEGMGQVVGGKLYVFGGYANGVYKPVARVDVYDPANNAWKQLKDGPVRLTHVGTTSDDRYIYTAGGYPGTTNGQIFATADARKYDTQTDTWTSMKSLPSARGGGQLVRVGREIYFIGGSDIKRADKSDVWSLNLDTPNANWVTRQSLPQARNHFGAVAINGKIYAIGGQTGQDDSSVFRNNVWCYDPSTNQWTEVAHMINQPRSHFAAATIVHNGKIIILGGETDSGTPGKPLILKNVEQYDPVLNSWTSLTSLPQTRTSGIAADFGDKILFATGQGAGFRGETWMGTFG